MLKRGGVDKMLKGGFSHTVISVWVYHLAGKLAVKIHLEILGPADMNNPDRTG